MRTFKTMYDYWVVLFTGVIYVRCRTFLPICTAAPRSSVLGGLLPGAKNHVLVRFYCCFRSLGVPRFFGMVGCSVIPQIVRLARHASRAHWRRGGSLVQRGHRRGKTRTSWFFIRVDCLCGLMACAGAIICVKALSLRGLVQHIPPSLCHLSAQPLSVFISSIQHPRAQAELS